MIPKIMLLAAQTTYKKSNKANRERVTIQRRYKLQPNETANNVTNEKPMGSVSETRSTKIEEEDN